VAWMSIRSHLFCVAVKRPRPGSTAGEELCSVGFLTKQSVNPRSTGKPANTHPAARLAHLSGFEQHSTNGENSLRHGLVTVTIPTCGSVAPNVRFSWLNALSYVR
jgi:hypothetical protein